MDNTIEVIEVTENNNPPQEKYFYNIADPIILYLCETDRGTKRSVFFIILWYVHIALHFGSLGSFAAILDKISVYPIEKIEIYLLLWGIITIFNFQHLFNCLWKVPIIPKLPRDNTCRKIFDIINLFLDLATIGVAIGGMIVTVPLIFLSYDLFLQEFIISLMMLLVKQISFFFFRLAWMEKVRIN